MLTKLMRPQLRVRLALSNPVLVRPGDEVVAAEFLHPDVDGFAVPGRDGSAAGGAGGGVGGWVGIILSREVAVLRVGAVAEVGPEAVEAPVFGGQELAGGFAAGVDCPDW